MKKIIIIIRDTQLYYTRRVLYTLSIKGEFIARPAIYIYIYIQSHDALLLLRSVERVGERMDFEPSGEF